MADIFREVDEEVRRDKALEFWKKYQVYLIALIVLVVAGAGAWRFYETRSRAQAEAAGTRYEEAAQLVRDGKTAQADEALRAIIAEGPPGYALLARFAAASNLAGGDADKAVGLYEGLANDSSVNSTLRDVARLRAAVLRLDTADYREMRTRLEPLTQVGGAFRNSAREYLAIAAFKANDLGAAGKWLDAIVVDQDAPAQIRARAEALLGLVTAGPPKP